MTREIEPAQKGSLKLYLEALKPKLAEVASKHLTPERLVRTFLGEAIRNPKISECTQESILTAILTCSQLGLEPASPLQLVALIPRRNSRRNVMELGVLLEYRGMIALAYRVPDVVRIGASVFYQSELDSGALEIHREPPALRHQWTGGPKLGEKIAGAYAVAELKDGRRFVEALTLDEIESRRSRSRARNDGPWITDYPAMARKSAIRALLGGGTVPLSTEMREALSADADAGEAHAPPLAAVEAQAEVVAPAPTSPLDAVTEALESAPGAPVAMPPSPEPPARPAPPETDDPDAWKKLYNWMRKKQREADVEIGVLRDIGRSCGATDLSTKKWPIAVLKRVIKELDTLAQERQEVVPESPAADAEPPPPGDDDAPEPRPQMSSNLEYQRAHAAMMTLGVGSTGLSQAAASVGAPHPDRWTTEDATRTILTMQAAAKKRV